MFKCKGNYDQMRSRVTYVYLCEKEIAHALRLKPQREPFSTNKGNKKTKKKHGEHKLLHKLLQEHLKSSLGSDD